MMMLTHIFMIKQRIKFQKKEQFEYTSKKYNIDWNKILIKFVNHNSEQFLDFVLLLNNLMKFKAQEEECGTFKYVKLIFRILNF